MTLRLNGSSSGYIELDAPATAGGNTITLPTSNGSAEQFLKNSGTAGELEYSSMIEDSSGRLGIGTTSPSSLIHGEVSSGSATLTLKSTATSGEASVSLTGENSSGTARTGIFKYDNGDLFRLGTSAGVNLRFETNDTERVRIESGGRIGLGPENAGSTVVCSTTQSAGTSYAVLSGTHSYNPVGELFQFVYGTTATFKTQTTAMGLYQTLSSRKTLLTRIPSGMTSKIFAFAITILLRAKRIRSLVLLLKRLKQYRLVLFMKRLMLTMMATPLETVTESVNYSVLYMKAVKALQEKRERERERETLNQGSCP